MTGKRCILKPRVSYKKIPKKCFEICKNISNRQTRRKRKNRKIVEFKTEPPPKPIIQIESQPTDIPVVEDLPNVEEPVNEETPNETPVVEAPPNEEPTNEIPMVEEESNVNEQPSIINSIQKTASKIFGLSPSSNNDIKNGGKSSKKRKSKRNKLNKTNKRTK